MRKNLFIISSIIIMLILVGALSNAGETKQSAMNEQVSKPPMVNVSESPMPTTSVKLSVEELLNYDGHPRVFDTWTNAKGFYEKIGDDRVVITSGAEKALRDMEYEEIESDTNVLYLIRHSTDPEYIGTVEMRIFDPKYKAKITLNHVVKLIRTYLPEDFQEYYKLDAAYMHKLKGLITYTYACRLNDAGIEHQKLKESQYSNYYYFKIYKYSSGGWIVETGYSAYGDKDKGWIEKYAEPWNIEL